MWAAALGFVLVHGKVWVKKTARRSKLWGDAGAVLSSITLKVKKVSTCKSIGVYCPDECRAESVSVEVVVGGLFRPPSLLFCMPLHFECLMHQILICHSFILDSSFILWVMWLTEEMCRTTSQPVESCLGPRLHGVLNLTFPPLCILNSPAFDRDKLIYSAATWSVFLQQFMDAVERYCKPVAVISISCIIISFLTALISGCSALLCPFVSFSHFPWKRQTCF